MFTQLNVKTVLFQTIQFSIYTVCFFSFTHNLMEKQLILNNSVLRNNSLVLFDPYIGPYQVLPLWFMMDLGAMAMKGYSAFPIAPVLLEPHYQIVHCHIRTLVGEVLPLFREAVGVFYSPSQLADLLILRILAVIYNCLKIIKITYLKPY